MAVDFLFVAMSVILVIVGAGIASMVLSFKGGYTGVLASFLIWSFLAYFLWIGAVSPEYEALEPLLEYEPLVMMICFGGAVGSTALLGVEVLPEKRYGLLWLGLGMLLALTFFVYVAPSLDDWAYHVSISWS